MFLAFVFDDFLEASGSIFGVILLHVGRSFVLFPTLRKMAHPTKVLQIAVKSRVGPLENRLKSLSKMKTKRQKTKALKIWILGGCWIHFLRLLGAFWEPKGVHKSSEFLDLFLEAEIVILSFSGVRPAECAGSLGRIMEGSRNQIC